MNVLKPMYAHRRLFTGNLFASEVLSRIGVNPSTALRRRVDLEAISLSGQAVPVPWPVPSIAVDNLIIGTAHHELVCRRGKNTSFASSLGAACPISTKFREGPGIVCTFGMQ